MKKNPTPLQFDRIYYIMASAVEGNQLFHEERNYLYFLSLTKKYLNPFIKIWAFCLLPDQIHLIVRIPDLKSIKALHRIKRPEIFSSLQFSHLFNAYAQAIGKSYKRHGGLFKRPFYRKELRTSGQLEKCLHHLRTLPAVSGYDLNCKNHNWTRLLFDSTEFVWAKEYYGDMVSQDFSVFVAKCEGFKPPPTPII